MNLESPWAAWISSWTSVTSQQHHKQKLKNASSSESMCPMIPCSLAGVTCHLCHGICLSAPSHSWRMQFEIEQSTFSGMRLPTNKKDKKVGVARGACFCNHVSILRSGVSSITTLRRKSQSKHPPLILLPQCKRICKVSVCIHHLQQYKAWRDQPRFWWWINMCFMIHLWNWNSFSFEQSVRIHFVKSSFGKHGESYYDKSMSFPRKVHSTSSQLSTHRLSNRNRDPRVACQDTRVPDLLQVAVNLWPFWC